MPWPPARNGTTWKAMCKICTLLVAESDPKAKEVMIRLIENMLALNPS